VQHSKGQIERTVANYCGAQTVPEIFIPGLRFEIFAVLSMKMVVFCDVAPCSLVDIEEGFRLTYCLHYQ
jgi:hypothetical protein